MSIYDEIGGAGAIAWVVDKFYQRVLHDSELAPYFKDVNMDKIQEHQGAFLTAALGGPDTYRGVDMGTVHKDMSVTSAHFDRVVLHLAETLKEHGTPQDVIDQIGGRLFPLKAEIVTAD